MSDTGPHCYKKMRVVIAYNGVQYVLGVVDVMEMDFLRDGGVESKYGKNSDNVLHGGDSSRRHRVGMKRMQFRLRRWFKTDVGKTDLLYLLHNSSMSFDLVEYVPGTSVTPEWSGVEILNCKSYSYGQVGGTANDIIVEEIRGEGLTCDEYEYALTTTPPPPPYSNRLLFVRGRTTQNAGDVITKINFDDYDYPWEVGSYFLDNNDNCYYQYSSKQSMCVDDDYIYLVGRTGSSSTVLSIRKVGQVSMGYEARVTETVYPYYATVEQKGEFIYVVCGEWEYSPAKYLKVEKRNKSDLSLVTSTDLDCIGDDPYSYPYNRSSLVWDSVDPDILWIGTYDIADDYPMLIKFNVSTMSIVAYEWYDTMGAPYLLYVSEDTDYVYATFRFFDTYNVVKIDKSTLAVVATANAGGANLNTEAETQYVIGNNLYFPVNLGVSKGIRVKAKSDLSDLYSVSQANAVGLVDFSDAPTYVHLVSQVSPFVIRTYLDDLASLALQATFTSQHWKSSTAENMVGVKRNDVGMTPIPPLTTWAGFTTYLHGNKSSISATTTLLCHAWDDTPYPYDYAHAYATQVVGANTDIYVEFDFTPTIFDKSNSPNWIFAIQTSDGTCLFRITVHGVTDTQDLEAWDGNHTTDICTISKNDTAHIKVWFKTARSSLGKYYIEVTIGATTYTNMEDSLPNEIYGAITTLWFGANPPYIMPNVAYTFENLLVVGLPNSVSNGDFATGDLTNWTTNDAVNVTVTRGAKHWKAYGCQITAQNKYVEQTLSTPANVDDLGWFDVWVACDSGGVDYEILVTYTDTSTTTIAGMANTSYAVVDVLSSLTAGKTIQKIRITKTNADPSTLYVNGIQCSPEA